LTAGCDTGAKAVRWSFVSIGVMAKKAIMQSVEQVLGHPAEDAVLIVHRKRWALPVFFAIFLVAYVVINAIKPGVLGAAVAGGCAGASLALAQQYRFIARSGNKLMLLSSKRWLARADGIIREIHPNEVVTVKTPGINKTIAIENTRYVVSRIFVSRLENLLGRPL
jgi:hypothetical protein